MIILAQTQGCRIRGVLGATLALPGNLSAKTDLSDTNQKVTSLIFVKQHLGFVISIYFILVVDIYTYWVKISVT